MSKNVRLISANLGLFFRTSKCSIKYFGFIFIFSVHWLSIVYREVSVCYISLLSFSYFKSVNKRWLLVERLLVLLTFQYSFIELIWCGYKSLIIKVLFLIQHNISLSSRCDRGGCWNTMNARKMIFVLHNLTGRWYFATPVSPKNVLLWTHFL